MCGCATESDGDAREPELGFRSKTRVVEKLYLWPPQPCTKLRRRMLCVWGKGKRWNSTIDKLLLLGGEILLSFGTAKITG